MRRAPGDDCRLLAPNALLARRDLPERNGPADDCLLLALSALSGARQFEAAQYFPHELGHSALGDAPLSHDPRAPHVKPAGGRLPHGRRDPAD